MLQERQWPNRVDNTMEARVSGHSRDAKKGVRNWNWPLTKGVPVCSHKRCMGKMSADKSFPSYKSNPDKFILKNAFHWRMKFHFEGPLTGANIKLAASNTGMSAYRNVDFLGGW